jgi:hypothetical protein
LSYAEHISWPEFHCILDATADCEHTIGGDTMLKKVLGWAIVVFIAFYLISDPNSAGGTVHHIVNGLHSAGTSLAKFVSSL